MDHRQPNYAPNQFSGWEQSQNPFLSKARGGKYEVNGIVADCFRMDRHYSGSYRLFRTVVYGEPFQFRKNGRNMYGASAVYTVLRIMPHSGNEAINALCCGECGLVAAGDEVTLLLSKARNGEYILRDGINHSTNTRINRDPLTVSPTTLRVIVFVTALLLVLMVFWLASGGISKIVSGILSAFGWLLSVLWRVFGTAIIIVFGIVWLVRSSRKK